jgi:GT2 family glycosyltransferase
VGRGTSLSLDQPRVGIVVPTLGERPEYLNQCLRSIRAAGEAHISLVGPKDMDSKELISKGLVDKVTPDPGGGLASAINAGIVSLPVSVEYVNWLGDDDLLKPGTIEKALGAMATNNRVVAVYGVCDYIDDSGELIWTNKSGRWAKSILRFGPDLIPQPGALIRRSAFESIGRLSSVFGWAFDFDMFIKLSKIGRLVYLPVTLASFRWHPDSLSVGQRRKSVSEASEVRKSHLPTTLRAVSELWELPIRALTYQAGLKVSKRATAKKGK